MNDNTAHSSPADKAKATADKAKATAENALEEIKVASNQVVDRVRDLIEEGNVSRISIRKDGKTLLELPLTIGAGAAAAALLLTPLLAAVGALAALVSDVTLVVEREGDKSKGEGERSQKPQDAPASKPVTDHEGGDAAKDKTIGK